jgi:hypothetical protein
MLGLDVGFDFIRRTRALEHFNERATFGVIEPEGHLNPGWGHEGEVKGVTLRALEREYVGYAVFQDAFVNAIVDDEASREDFHAAPSTALRRAIAE